MYTNRFDSHTHSINSHDGSDSVSDLCQSAVQNGLLGISITDHFECNYCEELGCADNLLGSRADTAKARSEFEGRLVVSQGIELGQPLQNEEMARKALAMGEYDFVLGSLHNSAGQEDFCFTDFRDPKVVVHDLITQYYRELLELAQSDYYDILSHLTYPVRYIWGKARIPVRLEEYQQLIDPVLRTLAERGKGLEINTSGIRQGLGFTLPSLKYIKRFRELGGELVTIGSDAHYAAHVGHGIELGMDMLKEAGFSYVAFFRRRQPVLLKLI